MAAVTLGTDTGGSCRIPAAFNGITGFKPTADRVPLDGIVPLAFSLDSAGPLGRTVDCCAAVDAILAGEDAGRDRNRSTRPRCISPFQRTLVFDGVDDTVAASFDRAVAALSEAGVRITDIPLSELAELPGGERERRVRRRPRPMPGTATLLEDQGRPATTRGSAGVS